MDVGITMAFQGVFPGLTDADVYRGEVEVALMAEPLGFDSVWTTEHHFTGFEMIPSPVQFLSYMAGATTRVKLGSMVVVVPWHSPYRVASEVAMLDHLSNGRFILGMGRGLGPEEFERFAVPREESRVRFDEHVTAILDSMETGVLDLDGTYEKFDAAPIRPRPLGSFRSRSYLAGISPETLELAPRLGTGLLLVPSLRWDKMKGNLQRFQDLWADQRPGQPCPPPLAVPLVYVDEDEGRAEEMAHLYMGRFHMSTMVHYQLATTTFSEVKGYEHYSDDSAALRSDPDKATAEFTDDMIWGTPTQVIEKLADLHGRIGYGGLILHFTYGGMPYEECKASMRLFAEQVLPVVHAWRGDEDRSLAPA